MVAAYYQDELLYLREVGRAFAEQYPDAAPFLSEASSDPSVERLLEGFAFLTGRLREKIDDELPELTRSLLESFCPHYLQPVPSLCIMQCRPMPKAFTQVPRVPRGSLIDSVPVDGTRCRFATTADCDVLPLRLVDVQLDRSARPCLRLSLTMLHGNAFSRLEHDRIRFHLTGDDQVARLLYTCFCDACQEVEVEAEIDGMERRERLREPVRGVGFDAEEAVLADPKTRYLGFDLLHQYFAFPESLLFVEVSGLDQLRLLEQTGTFSLLFHFDSLPEHMPEIGPDHLALNCVPAINRFPHAADPIHVDHEAVAYTVRPSGSDSSHYQVITVDTLVGLVGREGHKRPYRPMFHFERRDNDQESFFSLRQRPGVSGAVSTTVALQHGAAVPHQDEPATLSMELTCSNGSLPVSLDIDDLVRVVDGVPATVKIRNITKPTPPVSAPVDGDIHWRLLGHLRMNGASLANVEVLRTLIATYNFKAHVNRHERQVSQRLKDAIQAVAAKPEKRLYDGSMISGTGITIDIDEDCFASVGDLYLFASVLEQVFAQFVALNTFVRLTVRGLRTGERFAWPARLGRNSTI